MRNANLARRQAVEAVIGPVAEGLAYLYSALERRSLSRNSARDGDYTVHDLFVKCEVPVHETTIRALFAIPLGRDTALVTRQAYEAVTDRFRALAQLRPALNC
jgi:hypothetical protein